jgi:hypothetical protein
VRARDQVQEREKERDLVVRDDSPREPSARCALSEDAGMARSSGAGPRAAKPMRREGDVVLGHLPCRPGKSQIMPSDPW